MHMVYRSTKTCLAIVRLMVEPGFILRHRKHWILMLWTNLYLLSLMAWEQPSWKITKHIGKCALVIWGQQVWGNIRYFSFSKIFFWKICISNCKIIQVVYQTHGQESPGWISLYKHVTIFFFLNMKERQFFGKYWLVNEFRTTMGGGLLGISKKIFSFSKHDQKW